MGFNLAFKGLTNNLSAVEIISHSFRLH